MAEIQFTGLQKFALVAVENVYTDFPDGKDYNHQLSDGTWIYARVPVTIDTRWKEWIGTIRLEQLEHSNLIMIVIEGSANPQSVDEHHEKLKNRLWRTFCLLQLSGVLEYFGANQLYGSYFAGGSEIRHMSKLPSFYQTKGYSRTPVTIGRLEKAVHLRTALEEMDFSAEEFKRLKLGWRVLMDGLQKDQSEDRIHQFIRSLEALILPEIGKTKQQFIHRCQTFAKASPDTGQILTEAFELRSMAEHLNDWEQALGSHPKSEREIVALHRTRQMEQLATVTYSHIFESGAIRNHFTSETKQREFWKLPDKDRRRQWGTQLDLTSISEVRSFDSWDRAEL